MERRALRPILILISDGHATDNFVTGFQALMEQPWGKRSVRVALSVNEDADYEMLEKFISNPVVTPLHMKDIENILYYFWNPEDERILNDDSSIDPLKASKKDSLLPIPAPPMASYSADVW